ncbi:MAG TPA: hypothetical protein VHQ01_07260 [Pyrinomonadaceae bacterium]|nr:hypothetical protein [Pyrinomonadaceae bacterium]
MTKRELKNSIFFVIRTSTLLFVLSFPLFAQGKNPIIFIPGLTGSELKHKDTGERVWFKTFKSKSEDLKLPISGNILTNHDNLVPGDILRLVKIGIFPSIDVYDGFIKGMELRAGYREESWEKPSETGFQDSIYVFPYDWRLDNVENARLLFRRIETLKLTLKKPNLKFDIVAHSMGGIIARYAAMYGDTELPAGNRKPVPTWAGAKLFDKIVLMGTPNEGSALSLNSLVNGFSIGGLRIDLPFVQDMSKYSVFTIPSAYQLLPAPGTLKVLDEKFEPVKVDIYDPKVWSKYGWNAIEDKDFNKKFTSSERKLATAYFTAALDRAKRLHVALEASPGKSGGIGFYVVGSDCKTALDSIVVYQEKDKWKTLFRPKAFIRSDGTKVLEEDVKKVMYSPGDGIVTSHSLEGTSEAQAAGVETILKSAPGKFVCEDHNKLAANDKIQDYIIGILDTTKAKAGTGNGTVH